MFLRTRYFVGRCKDATLSKWVIGALLFLPLAATPSLAKDLLNFNMPEQALSASLNRLAEQAGIQIFYQQKLVDNIQSPAVEGAYLLTEALDRLLENSTIEYQFIDDSTITLRSKSPTIDHAKQEASPVVPVVAKRTEAKQAIEEVIITARKRAEEVQNVPLAVSVLSSQDEILSFSRDIRDIAFIAPNAIIESGNANTPSLSIRGISLSDLEKSFDPAIGIMIDDVYLGSTSAGLAGTFDIERIEILRGPQGTLQGKNTAGGLLKLVRTRPTGEWGGKIAVSTGAYTLNDIKSVFNVPIIEDSLAGKFSFYRKRGGGYIKNLVTGREEGGQDFTSLGVSLLYSPSETFEAQYSYTYDDDDAEAFPFVNSSPQESLLCTAFEECDGDIANPRGHTSTEAHPASFDVDLHILRLDWNLGHHQLTSITGFRDLNEKITLDYDASKADFYLTDRPATDTTLSEEIRIASLWSEYLEYVFGFFLWDREYTIDQTTRQLFGMPFYEGGGVQFSETLQQTDAWSLFMQSDVHLASRLTLTVGVRYTKEKKQAQGSLYYLDINGVSVNNPIDLIPLAGNEPTRVYGGHDSWSQLSPKLGLSYDFKKGAMLYLSYTEGFRSGGYNGRARTQAALGPYKPETVRTVELGLKSDWFDRSLRFNPTVFYTRYDDKQEEFATFTGGVPLTVIENASSAVLSGVELELQYLVAGFKFRANYGYLHSSYDNYSIIDASGQVVDKSGSRLLLAPRHTFAFSGQYTHTLPVYDADLIYGLGFRYTDQYQTSGDGPRHGLAGPYALVDASLSLVAGAWRLSLFGKNLGDKDYRPFTKNVTDTVTGTSLWSFSTVNPPRTWGLELGFQF